jgi:hypothetical protein
MITCITEVWSGLFSTNSKYDRIACRSSADSPTRQSEHLERITKISRIMQRYTVEILTGSALAAVSTVTDLALYVT